jgi:ABC-2 type transport system ATP-binding protein
MRDMRALIRRLADDGMTVLLSSHQLAEVEELCDRVAIVRGGAVVYEGGLDELRAAAGGGYLLRTTDDPLAARVCRAQPGVEDVAVDDDGIALRATEEDAGKLSVALVEAGIGILALVPRTATLEDLFFELTEGAGAVSASGLTPSQVEELA